MNRSVGYRRCIIVDANAGRVLNSPFFFLFFLFPQLAGSDGGTLLTKDGRIKESFQRLSPVFQEIRGTEQI